MAAPTEPSPTQTIYLRVTVRTPDLEAFIEKYARHIDGDRIFIFTSTPQAPGTRVRFTLQLASGERLIEGRGTVTRVQTASGDKRRPPGMELCFVALDERSQMLVDFMRTMRAAEPALVRAVKPERTQPPPLPPLPKPAAASSPSPKTPSASAPGVAPSLRLPPVPEPLPPAPEPTTAPGLPLSPLVPQHPLMSPRAEELFGRSMPTTAARRRLPVPAVASLPPLVPAATPPPPAAVASLPSPFAAAAPPPPFAAAAPPSPVAAAAPPSEIAAAAPPLEAATTTAVPLPKVMVALEESTATPPAVVAPPDLEPGPPPLFAEKWREPLPPGAPAAGTENNVPANPFSEVSDGAIEYFVEWSLDQSMGPRADQTSTFSDISMSLPGLHLSGDGDGAGDAPNPSRRRSRWAMPLFGLGTFAAGLIVGGVAMRTRAPAPVLTTRSLHVAEPPTARAEVAPAAADGEPEEAPNLPEPPRPERPAATVDAATVELSITTVPPGAEIALDGVAAGTSPLTTRVSRGTHDVTVSKDRYASTSQTVQAPGEANLVLKRPGALLRIESTPPGAQVTIGNMPRGATPLEARLPAFERYDVVVTRAGAPAWRRTIYLRGPKETVRATFPPVVGAAMGRSAASRALAGVHP